MLPVILSTVGVATGASGSAGVLKAVGLLSFPAASFAMAVKASLAVAVPVGRVIVNAPAPSVVPVAITKPASL